MSGEATGLAEVDVLSHIDTDEIPRDASGEPLTEQEKKIFDACEGLVKEYPETCKGAFRFGTQGGNDLDLRLFFTTPPPDDKQKEIRERFRELDDSIDLYFLTEEEIKQGLVNDTGEVTKIEDHLKEGIDPHKLQDLGIGINNREFISFYIFATLNKFYEFPGEPLPEIDVNNLQISREGAIDWSHFYTSAFLNEYKHFNENNELDTKAYQARLAKFVSRVTLGSVLAQLDPGQLDAIKSPLWTAIQKADNDTSTDQLMIDALLHDVNARGFINEETEALLRRAGSIRSKPDDFDPFFVEQAEIALLYYGYQQGIERRFASGDIDYLTSYALEMLVKDIGILKEYNAGDELITQGKPQEDLYYIPIRGNKKGVRVETKTKSPTGEETVVERTEKPGNLAGEEGLFTELATETVTIQEDGTKVWVIDRGTLGDMFAAPEIVRELQKQVLSTPDARIADILLQYFSRHAFRLIRESFPHTDLLSGLETHELLKKGNPLVNYYLGDKFHEILKTFVDKPDSFVTEVSAEKPEQELTIFKQGEVNDKFYVVSEGTVAIHLDSGEDILLAEGISFGESAFFNYNLPTKGSATLSPRGRVLAIDVPKFLEFTQSHKEIDLPEEFQGKSILPRHLLYHLAAVGFGRLRRRLATQQ